MVEWHRLLLTDEDFRSLFRQWSGVNLVAHLFANLIEAIDAPYDQLQDCGALALALAAHYDCELTVSSLAV